jgi:glycosyltransferase involved in cell wall biosynthesis
MSDKKILSLGLFVNAAQPNKNIRTVEDRLAEIFLKNKINIISSSISSGRSKRLADNIKTIRKNKSDFDIALVPLFGTWPSFIWQEILTRLLKFYKKKIILTVHGGSIPARMEKDAARFLRALKRAHIVTCPSAFIQQYLLKYNVKTRLIENPVNLTEYIFQQKQKIGPRIIWMRAFDDVYNPSMAIRVAVLLAKKYPEFKMVMAGKGSMENEIKKMAQHFGLNDKIIFPGYINLQQKIDFVKEYDIYICTNKVDNAPVTFIEFMALGVPVISTNSGGIPYIIKDGENGLLTDVDDDEAMALQIQKLISEPLFSKKIIENAHEYSKRYDDRIIVEKWKEIFNELN